MFGLHKSKKKAEEKKLPTTVKENYLRYITAVALPDLKGGKYSVLGDLYSIFAMEKCEYQQIEVISALVKIMKQQTNKRLLQIESCFRQHNYIVWNVIEHLDRESVDVSRERFRYFNDEQYCWLLRLGTFDCNGYFRQKCMEALQGQEGSLPFFILRLNDWVKPVQECAFQLIENQIKQCSFEELCIALAYFQRVEMAERRNPEHMRLVAQQLRNAFAEKVPQASLKGFEAFVRNAVYLFLVQEKILSKEKMEQLLYWEKDGFGKRLLIQGILKSYACNEEDIFRYLNDKSAVVRRRVLEYQYEREKDAWHGLEEFLLDESKYNRQYASWILKKHTDISVLEYYLAALKTGTPKIAILGVGEHGTINELELIRPYLESSEEGLVKAALVAMGNLAGEKEELVYWKYLLDRRTTVSKQAYLVIRKLHIRYGVVQLYELYCERSNQDTGRYFLKLLLEEPSWKRLPYLLKLYNIKDVDMRDRVRKCIHVRNMYATVTEEQEQTIRSALEEVREEIPESLRKNIILDLKYVCKQV